MNRDTRMFLVVGIAVLTAAVASWAMYSAVMRQTPTSPKVPVVVAKRDLDMGAMIAEGDLKIVQWPQENQIAGAFASVDKVRDHALLSAVAANEPITQAKVAEKGVGLTPIIHEGFRAMSVKVNEVIGVAGFVTPGNRVDVLVTMRQERDAMARIVVENVEVLTAGAKYDDPEARKQGKPIPSTVVTLMVTPEQAERIAIASTQGQIMLALRNPLDQKAVPTPGVTGKELMARAASVTPQPAPAPERRPAPVRTAAPPLRPAPVVQPPCMFETFKAGKREVAPCS